MSDPTISEVVRLAREAGMAFTFRFAPTRSDFPLNLALPKGVRARARRPKPPLPKVDWSAIPKAREWTAQNGGGDGE